jgi:hypothetical protein
MPHLDRACNNQLYSPGLFHWKEQDGHTRGSEVLASYDRNSRYYEHGTSNHHGQHDHDEKRLVVHILIDKNVINLNSVTKIKRFF